jgi:hypothetical protein
MENIWMKTTRRGTAATQFTRNSNESQSDAYSYTDRQEEENLAAETPISSKQTLEKVEGNKFYPSSMVT